MALTDMASYLSTFAVLKKDLICNILYLIERSNDNIKLCWSSPHVFSDSQENVHELNNAPVRSKCIVPILANTAYSQKWIEIAGLVK